MAEGNEQDSNRPELVTYRSVLEKAIRDGKGTITSTKAQILIKLRSSLDISELEHNRIFDDLLKKYEEANIATYRTAIEKALLDQRLSNDEEAILELLRESMNINLEQHLKIVNETKKKLNLEKIEKMKYMEEPEGGEESGDGYEHLVPKQTDSYGVNKDLEQTKLDSEAGPEKKGKRIMKMPKKTDEDVDDSYYWVRKGELAWVSSEGNVKKAIKALTFFDKALEIDPENYLAWANKGLILKTLDQVEEALLCYNRALKINPSYTTVWYNKGVLLGSLGNFKEAINAFNTVLELNPDHEFAKRDKAILQTLVDEGE